MRYQTILILIVLAAFPPGGWAFNPAPAEGDFVLPMPHGLEMAFRPVRIGAGGGQYALREFQVGDPDGGFKESPTAMVIGGSFPVTGPAGADWVYYLGKYEVTVAQYHAVMGGAESAQKPDSPAASISWFDAMAFADRYTRWLLANAAESLPKNGSATGFVRLPTEMEWEFAARGGAAVSQDVFERLVPYDDALVAHEWHAGPESSHNKVRQAGVLEPNAIGLHDMLGNVAEMTGDLYRIEYYQGRSGGFVSRGGHYLTSADRIRSSLRTEEPFYSGRGANLGPNAKATLGFRLCISAPVFADRPTARALAAQWPVYRGQTGATLPAATSVKPTAGQVNALGDQAQAQLARLEAALDRRGIGGEPRRELERLKDSLGDIGALIARSEEDQAFSWVKIAAERAYFSSRELAKLPTLDKLEAVAAKTGRDRILASYAKRRTEIEANIAGALDSYSDSLRRLGDLRQRAVDQGFARYRTFLTERGSSRQMQVLDLLQAHLDRYEETGRAAPDLWRADFEGISF
jgi:formylglycine-generating enzyme required for sulfatase activity